MKNHQPILEYTILIVVLVFSIGLFFQIKNSEVNLCRRIFQGLIQGNYKIERLIDWENLKCLDVDVAAAHNSLANEQEKQVYKRAFISNFSFGFSKVGGKLKAFTHWRIYESGIEKTIVAADYSGYNKTLLLGISKLGRNKLVSLEWRADE